ncbi:MAG: hypothetical protein WCS69_07025 [Ignavibacteriaceae bacterium]
MKPTLKVYLAPVLLLLLVTIQKDLYGQTQNTIANLKGNWKFSIGDDKSRSAYAYDDRDWDVIKVPSEWENEGYHGYNGYAWYRKKVYISGSYKSINIYFSIGYIDDVDEVYFNGRLIGKKGAFPPNYETAYNQFREYIIPPSFINFDGQNQIAIRVYDGELAGGIVSGSVSIIGKNYFLYPDYSLDGDDWKFTTGDEKDFKEKNYDDSQWSYIQVPALWDNYGYANYDGFAWYRKKFNPGKVLDGKKLVLMLGQIDDMDETFINGVWVGSIGEINRPFPETNTYDYLQLRGYFIPDGLIKPGEENTIAVRVYDGFKEGGIYSGPIGFTTQEKYIKYWKSIKYKKESFWDKLFQN